MLDVMFFLGDLVSSYYNRKFKELLKVIAGIPFVDGIEEEIIDPVA
ncbi:MAG: hypothetical protein OEZ57_08185 [Nitrospirota bacterium]|nr:hypothetical protein [Nitrospirota bacterium]MDH5587431.1 hypothetical protein [Nitrospirota bacterium]MDH5774880.1 hypothetical protein [Nitrospirota bacterium]